MNMRGFHFVLLFLAFGLFFQVDCQSDCTDVLSFPVVARQRSPFDCSGNGGLTWNGDCFLIRELVNLESQTVPYSWASMRCPNGFHPANIYNQSHYDALLAYLQPMVPTGWTNMKLWLGMKYNPYSRSVQLYNGNSGSFASWFSGQPVIGGSMVLTGILIDPQPSDPQGMLTSSLITAFTRHGILCETGEETEVYPSLPTPPPTGSCPAPSFDFSTSCFSLRVVVGNHGGAIDFMQAQAQCPAGALLANIFSAEHYLLATAMLRDNLPSGFPNLKIWLGMEYDYSSMTLNLSDGNVASYTNWFPGRPGVDTARTKIALFVVSDPLNAMQGMFTTQPTGNTERHGVLCQQGIISN